MSEDLPVVDAHPASGEKWVLSRERDAATDEPTLLLTLASADIDAVRRWLAVAGSVGGRHLAKVVDAVPSTGGGVAVLFASPGAATLAEVVSRRGLLSAGEMVTVVAPLAQVLGALHARGMFLAGVAAETLWFAPDGRPVLVPVGFGGRESDDVVALSSMAKELLGRDTAHAAAVFGALDAAARGSLDAEGLASALLRAAPALPVGVDRTAPAPGRPRRRSRSVIAIGIVAMAAVCLGGVWGRRDGSGAVLAAPALTPVSTPSAAAPSWLPVMSQLERTRARAYATGDAGLLAEIYSTGSPTGKADRVLLGRMAAERAHAAGLQAYVEAVDVIAANDSRATLRVTDALTSYDVIGRTGRVLRHGEGRPAREWRVTLVRTDDRWRIWTVSALHRQRA